MTDSKKTVAEKRKYSILDVQSAKNVAAIWLKQAELQNAVEFGLPEIDDRYHIWRVPLISKLGANPLGEVVIDARTSLIIESKSTSPAVLEARLLGREASVDTKGSLPSRQKAAVSYEISNLRNTLAMGDCEQVLQELPAASVDLVFTSPPYYNARPEYADYITYEEYLLKLRKIIYNIHRVLSEGRFFVMNIAPVLIRRTSRDEASRRIAVPFDVHQIFVQEGYDFVDDIIWEKPEGAGWATSRGRRFAADRNPLQYKTVPVTEYILVYRKHTTKLIDWNIRAHPDQAAVAASKISDDYERTNIWRISPTYDKRHPAIFPVELAERVIKYYSFKNEVVLDPFAGIGTVGKAAAKLDRRFVLIEQDPDYVNIIRSETKLWLGKDAQHILTLNCPPISVEDTLF